MSDPEKWQRFKELPQDITLRLANLPDLLAQERVLLAYHFGSLAQKVHGEDVDLALLMSAGQRPFTLQEKINEFLDTERVDIIDLRRATPVMRFEIISTGRCIYAANDEIQGDMEISWLREYRDTAWLRNKHELLLRDRVV